MVKSEKIKNEQQNPISGNNNENNNNNNNSQKKYKGVRMRSWGSWVSEIRAPNQKTRIWLGSYSTADAAARAYDAALLCLKGSNASLNFPNSSRLYYENDIPHDVVLSPKSIQRVAAAAAANNTSAPTFADNDNNAIASVASTTPDNCSSSSSSSMVSSPSDCYHVEEFDDHRQQPTAVMEALYNFDAALDQYSPTMMTMMTSSSCFYDPQMMDDLYEESGDIRLWSFC